MFQYWCNYHEHCQNFYSIIHFVFMKFIFFVKRLLWCVTKFSTIGRCLGQHQTKSNECITMDGWCFEHDIVSPLYFFSLTIVPNKYGSRMSQGFYYWGSTIWMISKLEKGDCVLGLLCLFPYFVLPLFFKNLCIWTLQYCIFSLCLLHGANMCPLKWGACHTFQGWHLQRSLWPYSQHIT
jgi:hypothetical protein